MPRNRLVFSLLPNGEHNGNLWLKPPFLVAEPEAGRYTLTCSQCLREIAGFNWRTTSPCMFANERDEYICDECQLAVNAAMPYAEYLKTPHWQGVRIGALERARHRCQLCSSTVRLHVHHNTYERKGRERPDDVIVLCADCHEKHHFPQCGSTVLPHQSNIPVPEGAVVAPKRCELNAGHDGLHRQGRIFWHWVDGVAMLKVAIHG